MVAAEKLHSVGQVQDLVCSMVSPLPTEDVSYEEGLGRILGVAIPSMRTLPAFDNSAMDGFAVRVADIDGESLPVSGESRAGHWPDPIAPGTVQRISTGAPLPQGADAVVPIENVTIDSGCVTLPAAVITGAYIRRAGQDVAVGDVVLEAGRRLRSADLAVCAGLGRARVQVHRRPRIGVLSTGDELVDAGHEPGPAQVVDSNRVALAAAIREAGGQVVDLGIARDASADVRKRLVMGGSCDLIISSGGVSVGEHDHVRDVVAELGSLDLWRVAMRPGKPLAVGRVGNVPLLGLPGNVVSAQVTFELFGRPAILSLQGGTEVHKRREHVRVAEAIVKPLGLETFHRAVRSNVPGDLPSAHLTGSQDSGVMRSLVLADCLLVLPANTDTIPEGSLAEVIPLS